MNRCAFIFGLLLAAAVPAFAQQVFFGNWHSHTSFSDGSGEPAQAYAYARDTAKLDFLAITEHNHSQAEDHAQERKDGRLIATDPKLYEELKRAARDATRNGRFVAIYGQEVSSISKGNHVNVYDVDQVVNEKWVPNGRFDKLLGSWLQQNKDSMGKPALLQFNHPWQAHDKRKGTEYGQDDFATEAEWERAMAPHVRTLELLNGPAMTKTSGNRPDPREFAESAYLEYLRRGVRLAPSADQDNHYPTWGTATDARTAVIASELTKPALLEAIRARHVYATEDRNLRLVFRVEGKLCGDHFDRPPGAGAELDIACRLTDADEPDARYQVEVFAGKEDAAQIARPIAQVTWQGNTLAGEAHRIEGLRYDESFDYVFFKVTQNPQGSIDRAWTSPVWFRPQEIKVATFNVEAAPLAPALAGEPATEAGGGAIEGPVASRRSLVYHISAECRGARAIKQRNLLRGEDATRGRKPHENCPVK